MTLPRLVVTGASGFVGRHLLERIAEHYQIVGLARRTQARSGAVVHPNILWMQVDIGDRVALERTFRTIAETGGADMVLHLAAHYDFSGEEHPDYWRTNVDGLRHVLECCKGLGIRRFLFASSVAACKFPPAGEMVNEDSPPEGRHIYAVTKKVGEEMVASYGEFFPTASLRFAALFSDWCEYPPLFMFFKTWFSKLWYRGVLGGRGLFAIPYLHVRDATAAVERSLEVEGELDRGEVLLISSNEAVTLRDLYRDATHFFYGLPSTGVYMPKALCATGMYFRALKRRCFGHGTFDRPWMARYIDRSLSVDASRSHRRLSWQPRERLQILRRVPFLVENFKLDPVEWHRRNHAALKMVNLGAHLRIHRLLEKCERRICDEVGAMLSQAESEGRLPHYRTMAEEAAELNHRMLLHQLKSAVRTQDRSVYVSYCRDLAEKRFQQGFKAEEVCEVLEDVESACVRVLSERWESQDLQAAIQSQVSMTMLFGCDQVKETFDQLQTERSRDPSLPGGEGR